MIDTIKYLFLGLIQGITEPLPVSSSGHVLIINEIFKITFEDNFLIIINFASLLAIIFYFRVFIKDLSVGSFNYVFKKKQEDRQHFIYVLLVILATIPAAIAGLLLEDFISKNFSNLLSIGICLFITGSFVIFMSYYSKKALRTTVNWSDALLMGLGQVAGMLPGISRSGSTTAIGVSKKLELTTALTFSFMMYIPISVAAFALSVYRLISNGIGDVHVWGYTLAFIASTIATYFSLTLFFKLLKSKYLKYFGCYCIALSIAVLIYVVFI